MKRLISILAVCTIALSSVSCGVHKSSEGLSEPVTAEPQTGAVTTANEELTSTTTSTTTTAPLMPPMSQPVETFRGIGGEGQLFKLVSCSDNMLIFRNDSDAMACCTVFDPVSDSIVRKAELRDPGEELLGAFSDGTIVTKSSMKAGLLLFYPKGSNTPSEVDLGIDYYPGMYFDSKDDCIYYESEFGGKIIKVDGNGTQSTQIPPGEILSSYQIFPENDCIFAFGISDKTKDGSVSGICSLENGKLIREISGEISVQGTASDSLIGYSVTNDADGVSSCNDIHVLSLSDPDYNVYRMKLDNMGSTQLIASPYSDKVLIVTVSSGMYGSINGLYVLDTKTGRIADTKAVSGSDITNCFACFHEGSGRWMAALTKSDYAQDQHSFEAVMIDPELLTYDRQLGEGQKLEPAVYEPTKPGEGYTKVRRRADEIEKKYGVKVLVGNEVKDAEGETGYTFVSTEEDEYFTVEDAMSYLDGLDDLLGMYPKGFFLHFQTSDGRCGLRISLVKELKNDSFSDFSAGGISFMTGGWCDVAINIGSMSVYSTSFHHELWHCVEHLIGRKYGMIDEAEWNTLNPDGFSFTEDFDQYATSYGGTPYSTLSGEEWNDEKDYDSIYFISDYSIVTPMEDRATLIEQLFQCDYSVDPVNDLYPRFGIKGMIEYPRLMAKLDYLENWMKSEFDYIYWREMLK